jgi:sec-independent protein translocase protein TatC
VQESFDIYFPYLLEIRKRLLFLVSIFLVFAALGFIYYSQVITAILKIFSLEGVNLVFTSPFQFLSLAVTSGLLIGVVVVFPLAILQLLSFIKPALTKSEYKTILGLVPLGVILFISGFSFGVLMMRYVVIMFYQKSVALNIGNFLDVSQLLSQILLTAVFMGIAFQFPIILTALIKLKLITLANLKKQRALAYVASLIFAAFLPPSDLLSLALLTAPLILLYEFTLILNQTVLKTR